jgi:dTDP-4-dehydrorhamnose 3,5-epimerase-like enzyme
MKLVKLIELPYHKENNGDLVAVEGESNVIPFSIKRIFNVRAQKGNIRGRHAHRQCSQLLICTNGSIEVKCDDGCTNELYVLDKPNFGLLIAPGVWAEQRYMENNTILTVLCNRPFEEVDYLRNYEDFKIFAKKNNIKVAF